MGSGQILRITGMASGLDVDSMVKALMKADNMRLDKMKQDKQITQWRQDLYRDIMGDINTFKSTYFDVLKTDTYVLSPNNYSAFDVANVDTTTTSTATLSAGAGAVSGTYNIKDITIAKKASVTGGVQAVKEANSPVSSPVTSSDLTNYSSLTFNVNGDGNNYSINLASSYTSLSAMISDINSKLKSVTIGSTSYDISGKVQASLSADGTSIQFNPTSGNTLNSVLDASSNPIAGNQINMGINIQTGVNDTISLNVGGTAKTVTLQAGKYSLSSLVSEVNNEFTNQGINSNIRADLSLDGTRIKLTNLNPSTAILQIKGNAMATLGYPSAGLDDIYPSTSDRMSSLFSNDSDAKVNFSVNGKTFNFDFSSTGADRNRSIGEIINTISSQANCTINYSQLSRTFTIESTMTGSNQTITADETQTASGQQGKFLSTLFGTSTINKTGSDATATITDPNGTTATVTRSNNSFTIDGITYNLLKDNNSSNPSSYLASGIDISVTANTQATFDKITGFIDKYNEIVDKIQTKLNEKTLSDYPPLTDDQKAAMSADDIKAWEDKAKQGLLRNDGVLEGMLTSMRNAIYQPVKQNASDPINTNIGITLSDLGISTSSDYTQGGKLIVDQAKLKDAIQNKGDMVAQFFTKVSSSQPYYDMDANSTQRSNRTSEEGIFQRISDILQDNTRTTRNSFGRKGTLIELAGIDGDLSAYTNTLTNELNDQDKSINDFISKMSDEENSYYNKFSQLDTAMQQMNSQSSWLASQLGGK